MFFFPAVAHSSTCSGITDEGVIGYIAATSVNAYDAYAAASLPSMVFMFLAISIPPTFKFLDYFGFYIKLYRKPKKPRKNSVHTISLPRKQDVTDISLVFCRIQ
jgi:hypothetical protein